MLGFAHDAAGLRNAPLPPTALTDPGLCHAPRGYVAFVSGIGPYPVASSTQRIDDPWGARTPYPSAGKWPVRVDEYADGVVERWVQSACVLCSHGCGLEIGIRDGRIVG